VDADGYVSQDVGLVPSNYFLDLGLEGHRKAIFIRQYRNNVENGVKKDLGLKFAPPKPMELGVGWKTKSGIEDPVGDALQKLQKRYDSKGASNHSSEAPRPNPSPTSTPSGPKDRRRTSKARQTRNHLPPAVTIPKNWRGLISPPKDTLALE